MTLKKLLQLAGEENVILRTSEGREYLLASIDDFSAEVVQVRKNAALMKTLEERSPEEPAYSLAEVRKKLKLK
jgi:hypothetical protein